MGQGELAAQFEEPLLKLVDEAALPTWLSMHARAAAHRPWSCVCF